MFNLIPTEAIVAVMGAIFAALAWFVGKTKGTRDGKRTARYENIKRDAERSQEIERKADEARNNKSDAPVDDRLRGRGRLRSD